jgi:hypothetical protein
MPFHNLGINAGFMALQALNCLVLLVWLGLSIAALLGLRKKSLGEVARVLWTLIILIVPIMGAVAFWIVNPSSDHVDGGVG